MEMRESHRREYSLKVILLGDPGVGKSTLMEAYCLPHVHGYMTMGRLQRMVSLMMEDITLTRGEDTVRMRLMDTGGQERYKSLTASYYRHAHGCILVFDLSNRTSLDNIQLWWDNLNMYNADVDSVTLVLVGTLFKKATRGVTYEQGVAFAENMDIPYFEILSRDRNEIGAIFEYIADSALSKIKGRFSLISTRINIKASTINISSGELKAVLKCQC